jgi:hypothetical protein
MVGDSWNSGEREKENRINLFQGQSNGRKDETLMGAGMEYGGHLAVLLFRRWKQ